MLALLVTLVTVLSVGDAPAAPAPHASDGARPVDATPARGAIAARLVLASEARVRGTELDLGALASVDCADAATKERLQRHSLGWAPAPGYSRFLQRALLERDLAAAFPGVALTLTGPDGCRVHPRTEVLAGPDLLRVARAELDLLFHGREIDVRATANVGDLEVPEPRTKRELRARLDSRELRGGAWTVPVQIWIDGALYRTVWAAFSVELWGEIPVLVRDVGRGELLGPNDVERRRARIDGASESKALTGDSLAGAVAQRELARGSVVTDRDVRRAKLVGNGEPVTLEVRKGAVVARSTVTCKQDGSLGDPVKVQGADRTRELLARVAGRALVVIEL